MRKVGPLGMWGIEYGCLGYNHQSHSVPAAAGHGTGLSGMLPAANSLQAAVPLR